MGPHRPSFYEKQIMWKRNRERILQDERVRKAQEETENEIANSSPRKIFVTQKKNYLNPENKFSKMEKILEDLSRINMILAEENEVIQ